MPSHHWAQCIEEEKLNVFVETGGACREGPRPCGFWICRYWLGRATVDDEPSPEVHIVRGDCALDCADRGGMKLREVAKAFGVTRNRIDQIEFSARAKLRRSVDPEDLDHEHPLAAVFTRTPF